MIKITDDGGFVTVGYEYLVRKFTSDGNIEWEHKVGGLNEIPTDFQVTADGGYIIAGYDYTGLYGDGDLRIDKLSNDGTVEWTKYYGGSIYEQASRVLQTTDGGFIVIGETSSSDGDVSGNHTVPDEPWEIPLSDAWALKLNSNGDLEWEKCYGFGYWDEGHSIELTDDGEFFIVGDTFTANHGAGSDLYLIKTTNDGTEEWQTSNL